MTAAGVLVTFNLYTALTLWAAGAAGLAAWWRIGARSGAARYWGLAGAGMVYLGFDEHFSLHERMGRRLAEAGLDVPGFHDADGLVLIAFAAGGLAVSVAFAGELLAHRRVLSLLFAGGVATVLAFVLDDFGSNRGFTGWAEERLEWLGAAFYLAAFVQRWREAAAPAEAVRVRLGEPLEEGA